MKKYFGFSLVEMMVSITLASFLSLAIINVFTSQADLFASQSRRNVVESDGQDVYAMLSRLIRQAEFSSIVITNGTGTAAIDFTVPAGFSIWPNTTGPSFNNNAIRIGWSDDAKKITTGTATTIGGLSTATMSTLIGDLNNSNTQVTNLALTDNADGTFLLSMSFRSGATGVSRTVSGEVVPRN